MKEVSVSVYKITNIVNGKIYVGQTSQIPSRRWWRHVSDAIKGSNLYFSRAIRKYGKESFILETIFQGLTREQANQKEQDLITLLDTLNPEKGYNATYGGVGANHTEETKAKISAWSTAYWSDPSNRAHQREVHKGLLLGEKNPMYGLGENHPFFGRKHTEETKTKISEYRKERFQNDPEFKVLTLASLEKARSAKRARKLAQSDRENR